LRPDHFPEGVYPEEEGEDQQDHHLVIAIQLDLVCIMDKLYLISHAKSDL
jgi:hypothetical protein